MHQDEVEAACGRRAADRRGRLLHLPTAAGRHREALEADDAGRDVQDHDAPGKKSGSVLQDTCA